MEKEKRIFTSFLFSYQWTERFLVNFGALFLGPLERVVQTNEIRDDYSRIRVAVSIGLIKGVVTPPPAKKSQYPSILRRVVGVESLSPDYYKE